MACPSIGRAPVTRGLGKPPAYPRSPSLSTSSGGDRGQSSIVRSSRAIVGARERRKSARLSPARHPHGPPAALVSFRAGGTAGKSSIVVLVRVVMVVPGSSAQPREGHVLALRSWPRAFLAPVARGGRGHPRRALSLDRDPNRPDRRPVPRGALQACTGGARRWLGFSAPLLPSRAHPSLLVDGRVFRLAGTYYAAGRTAWTPQR